MQPLFFCHIPKTGGTSLRAALEAKFQPWEILPDQYMISRGGGLYPSIEVWRSSVGPKVRLLRGHFHLAVGKLLGPDASFATVIREPVSRTISHIGHTMRHFGMTAEMARAMFDKGYVPLIDNVQCRYLAGFESVETLEEIVALNDAFLKGTVTDPIKNGLADDAIAASEKCAHIGLTDELSRMATSLDVSMAKKNANIGISNFFEFTDNDLNLIRERNAADLALYEHVKRRLANSSY